MSVKEEVIQVLLQRGLIQWVLRLLEKHRTGAEIHIFSLDFASALLANILHSHQTLEVLEKQISMTKATMNGLLALVKEPQNIAISVLLHVLICLSYLSKERFSTAIEDTHFVDKISDFVEVYS
jgi:hypothetical protein